MKAITYKEILALEQIYLLNASKKKHKLFKRVRLANSEFLISKN